MNDFRDRSLDRGEHESEDAYIIRICDKYRCHMELPTWYAVMRLLNSELEKNYDESAYRKRYAKLKELVKDVRQREYAEGHPEDTAMLAEQSDMLYRAKVRAQDAIREKRADLRHEARVEELKEHIQRAAKTMPVYPIATQMRVLGSNEAVAVISDWHIGAWVNTRWEVFNIEVARERVAKYAERTIAWCRQMGVRKLHVINTGDLIEGNIHVTTRVTNELDVIESTMRAGELLLGYLTAVEGAVDEIDYGETLDNHGRATANYKEHIEAENFGRFISWWMAERLANLKSKVKLTDNYWDANLGRVVLDDGRVLYYVHGHLDKQSQVFSNLIALTREVPSLVVMGHTHTALAQETNFGEVFVGGSLKGMDDYGRKKHYVRTPSQKLIIFEAKTTERLDINIEL